MSSERCRGVTPSVNRPPSRSSVPGPRRARCDIRIGTSGWHYKHWLGPFYPPRLPAKRMLAWYMERFDTVEVNNTFYRLPTKETLRAWRDGTPPAFRFAVKGSRYISHRKKLNDPEPALARFLPLVETLGAKLGPILFQLPPRWSRNVERLNRFLDSLPPTHRYSFEFRDPSWHDEAVYGALRKHQAAFCIYELAGFESPHEVTADFAYVRLHGPEGKYGGDYSAGTLARWAERIDEWRGSLSAVYVYFDNDQAAYAAKNAAELKRLVRPDP
ncbi:MAG TPA: DUF72 domain-containing protein [Nitrospira sp.]|nr:DUF72 domain-containing protein [Nitrospira sp.]